jgi:hypothetical protein
VVWDPGGVGYWEFDGGVYEVVSFYSVAVDAWTYELTGPAGSSTAMPGLTVIIPDATPDDGSFTASPSASVRVITTDGILPWPMLAHFMDLVESSGDIAVASDGPTVAGDVHLSHNKWAFADRRYEVNSYSLSEQDFWCYELYQAVPVLAENDFIEVCISTQRRTAGPSHPLQPSSWS